MVASSSHLLSPSSSTIFYLHDLSPVEFSPGSAGWYDMDGVSQIFLPAKKADASIIFQFLILYLIICRDNEPDLDNHSYHQS